MTTANTGHRRPGRPSGSSGTRNRILTSARELFARNGIGNTSIRAVAAAAGVDSALVHHYFGTKEQLFAAAVHIPIDPMDIIGPLREVPIDEIGYRLRQCYCRCGIPTWVRVYRDAAIHHGRIGSQPVRTFIQDVIARKWARALTIPRGRTHPHPVRRSQLMGVVMARYIVNSSRSRRCRPSRSRERSRRTCSATSLGICRTSLLP